MLGIDELKETIEITQTTVECPVKGCTIAVKKMVREGPRLLDSYLEKGNTIDAETVLKEYFCKNHKIWITPSTLLYAHFTDNLLWKEEKDIAILKNVLLHKRIKAQLHHDNSEDAVTWNVFRFLEKNNLIEGLLSSITGIRQEEPEIIYWSYSRREGGGWSLLNKARGEFGEKEGRGSEPDIIIETNRAMFFIEAKLTSGNNTPSDEKQVDEKIRNPKKYKTGGANWFGNVFVTSYEEIVRKQKYELLRFWLLGTWMAEQARKEFHLINLVPEEREQDIEVAFKKHIKEKGKWRFLRLTWESIHKHISNLNPASDNEIMTRFFKNKTIGYRNGVLQKAFQIS
jgi:hypothetical protein